ncbi:MAG TPA: MaoC family dehydratase N-terminal domain-containing protein [Acidimicrobiales bacterium]|nr:MaoC family dehydratase N-terminal domain-containing protein [Acidimicrobiales bacterium]
MTEPVGSEPVWSDWGPPVRVRIDPATVWAFARAVRDPNPLYRSQSAATDAGLDGLPVPPTFTFVMTYFGAWPDLQPPGGTGRLYEAGPESLGRRPGLDLHGEQEFVYHRAVVAGEVLEARMRTSAPWRKEGRRPMELRLLETRWSDLDGVPVVSETTTAIYIPTEAEL